MSNTFSATSGLNVNASMILQPIATTSLKGKISIDNILPENVFDAMSILKSDAQIKICDMIASNNSVTANGTVLYTVLLLGEDGTLSTVNVSDDFEIKEFIDSERQALLDTAGVYNEEDVIVIEQSTKEEIIDFERRQFTC